MSRKLGSDEGASAVELAVLMPLLLLILFGIIDFGFVFMSDIAITNAAHEGARVLALGETTSNSQTRAVTTSGITSAPIPTAVGTSCISGGNATMIVNYTYKFKLISILPLVPKTKTMSAKAVEKCVG